MQILGNLDHRELFQIPLATTRVSTCDIFSLVLSGFLERLGQQLQGFFCSGLKKSQKITCTASFGQVSHQSEPRFKCKGIIQPSQCKELQRICNYPLITTLLYIIQHASPYHNQSSSSHFIFLHSICIKNIYILSVSNDQKVSSLRSGNLPSLFTDLSPEFKIVPGIYQFLMNIV